MHPKLKEFFLLLRVMLDNLIDIVFGKIFEDKKKPIPPLEPQHKILTESATTLARMIREKKLKSEHLVQTVIDRMHEVNPMVNAIAMDRSEVALAEARAVDALIAAGLSEEEWNNKPFLGVPFTAKEAQAVKGMPLTMGLWSRRREVADEDSAAIAKMKAAGAIVLAVTNLPELLVWQETRNPVYGCTQNPHHTGRTPGGSSGGEAALTACYATPISLCSDIGGSTRMPAFYCGMFGYHPTAGVTDMRGVFFRQGHEQTMLSLGFISKHVEDLAPLTKVIGGDKAHHLNLDKQVDIKDIKFYYMETSKDIMLSQIRPDLRKAMLKVVANLTGMSSTENAPEPYYHQGFNYMYRLWNFWMAKEPDNYAKIYNNHRSEANGVIELVKKMLCQSQHYWFTILRLLELQWLPLMEYGHAEKLTKLMKDDLFEKLGNNGVLIMPSATQAAPYHYTCFLRPFNFAYWAIVNVLKSPAVQVPLGLNDENLPLGVQVVAAPNNDHLCLTVAKYLEKEFGGAVMACDVID